MIPLVMLISVLSLAFAVYLAREVLAADEGTPQMQEIAGAIKEGAEAFLRRQNATIFVIGLGVAAVIFVLYAFVRPHNPNDPTTPFNMAVATTLAFCFGALCSGVSGYIGMFVSIRANLRTASAVRSSRNRGQGNQHPLRGRYARRHALPAGGARLRADRLDRRRDGGPHRRERGSHERAQPRLLRRRRAGAHRLRGGIALAPLCSRAAARVAPLLRLRPDRHRD